MGYAAGSALHRHRLLADHLGVRPPAAHEPKKAPRTGRRGLTWRFRHLLTFVFVFPLTFGLAEEFSHWAGLSRWALIAPVGAVFVFFLLLGLASGDPEDFAPTSSSA